jgi:hypothetical protein
MMRNGDTCSSTGEQISRVRTATTVSVSSAGLDIEDPAYRIPTLEATCDVTV